VKTRPNYGAGFAAVIWFAIVALPIYVLVSASVRGREGYLNKGPLSLISSPTLSNFSRVLTSGFLQFIGNTVVITFAVVGIVLVLALPVAYAVVRGTGWLNRGAFRLFLLGLAIPSQAVIIPVFLIINRMGLYDTLWAVILPTAAFALPISVLILTGSMRDISVELYEAMAIDGARSIRVFFRLVLPLTQSGISTIAVFTALQAWNGFLFPLILTQSDSTKVVTLGLFTFVNQYGADIPALLAGVLLSAVPILVVYLFARRALISGLMGVGGK